MTTEQYQKELRANSIPKRFILLFSNQDAINEEILNLTYKWLMKEKGSVEKIMLHGHDVREEDLHAHLTTPPIFENARLVYLRHCDHALKKIDSNKVVSAYFQRDLKKIPDSIWVVFQIDGKKIPNSLDFLYKEAIKIEEENLAFKDLPAYLLQRARAANFETDISVMSIICEKCAYDQNQSVMALNQVITFCLHTKKITAQDVEEILFELEGDFNFKIIDAIGERDIDLAMKQILQHRFSDGLQVASGWIRTFTDAWRYIAFKKAGFQNEEIQKLLMMSQGQFYYFKKRSEKILQHYRKKELYEIVQKLPLLDKQLKIETKSEGQMTILIMFLESIRKQSSLFV